METPEENMRNAGIVFMFTAWIQGQMSDLVIFKKHPEFIQPFIETPNQIPAAFAKIRFRYWEKQFAPIKKEFIGVFSNCLTVAENRDIEEIYHWRNMIAHAHVSLGRDYMLYRPTGANEREAKLISDMGIRDIENRSDPILVKIELAKNEQFERADALIKRLDQITLSKVAASIGVPHGRIR